MSLYDSDAVDERGHAFHPPAIAHRGTRGIILSGSWPSRRPVSLFSHGILYYRYPAYSVRTR